MARGYLYEIAADMDNLGEMDESDFYGNVGYEAVYFQNESDNHSAESLIDYLKQFGMEIGTKKDTSGREYPWFSFSKESREEYFRKKYVKTKEIVDKMTLEEFSTDVVTLMHTIEDTYSDAMYFNDSIYSMDHFFREMGPGRYYIGNIVYMG